MEKKARYREVVVAGALTDVLLNNAIVSAKKGEAPIGGRISEDGAGIP